MAARDEFPTQEKRQAEASTPRPEPPSSSTAHAQLRTSPGLAAEPPGAEPREEADTTTGGDGTCSASPLHNIVEEDARPHGWIVVDEVNVPSSSSMPGVEPREEADTTTGDDRPCSASRLHNVVQEDAGVTKEHEEGLVVDAQIAEDAHKMHFGDEPEPDFGDPVFEPDMPGDFITVIQEATPDPATLGSVSAGSVRFYL